MVNKLKKIGFKTALRKFQQFSHSLPIPATDIQLILNRTTKHKTKRYYSISKETELIFVYLPKCSVLMHSSFITFPSPEDTVVSLSSLFLLLHFSSWVGIFFPEYSFLFPTDSDLDFHNSSGL